MKPAEKLKLRKGDHLVDPNGWVHVISKSIDPECHWLLTPLNGKIKHLVRRVELKGWYKVSLCVDPSALVIGKLYCMEQSNNVFEYGGASLNGLYLCFAGTGSAREQQRSIRYAGLRAACVYGWSPPPPKPKVLPANDPEVVNVRQRRASCPPTLRRDGWVFAVPDRGSVEPVCTERELSELMIRAESLIDARAVMVLDLASNLGQMLDNVKHMRWFAWEVACDLSTTVKKWSKFQPLFGIHEK